MSRAQEEYHQAISDLSERIVSAQQSIRILDGVKWDDSIEADFFANGFKELPKVTEAYYSVDTLGFDPDAKISEFQEIDQEITRRLGRINPVGGILRRMCREYQAVAQMLKSRGTPEFGRLARELYGSTDEAFHAGEKNLADLGRKMSRNLNILDRSPDLVDDSPRMTAEEGVDYLNRHLTEDFGMLPQDVRVILDDGIVADAAAGSDYIKLRRDATFSIRDLELLRVHEGWVHIGTNFNGANQRICRFLSKGPPSSTVTQEGLAVLMEVIAMVSHPNRLRRLAYRIHAVEMVEKGADFLQVFEFCRGVGMSEKEAYVVSMRVFRGSVPNGLPFPKDISYTKGFILLYNFLRFAVRAGKLDTIQLLFSGKTVLEDLPTMRQLLAEKILDPPRFVPPQFANLHSLSAWLCFTDLLDGLSSDRLEADYAGLI